MEHENVTVNCVYGPRPKPKLLERARDIIRLKHYSIRTERTYLNWMRRYILFHHKRHPQEMGPAEIEAFLTHLAVDGNVARSTQNQAFHALLFLYREVLGIALDDAGINAMRAHKKGTLPVVLSFRHVGLLHYIAHNHRMLVDPSEETVAIDRAKVEPDGKTPAHNRRWFDPPGALADHAPINYVAHLEQHL